MHFYFFLFYFNFISFQFHSILSCASCILLSLISFFINKLNLHLVRTLQYCSQFHINVQHCFDWLNTVSDTLSHLLNKITNSKNQSLENMLENIDEKIHIYHIIVIKMLFDFWNKIKKVYLKNKKWKKKSFSNYIVLKKV